MPRTYVDNAYNRRAGRVGLPVGSAVISKNTVCGINTRTYADNDYNRRLGRVGMSHGTAVDSKYSDGLIRWNYLDIDRQGKRQVCDPSVSSSSAWKNTGHTRDISDKHAWKESNNGALCLTDAHQDKSVVLGSKEKWRSSSRSSEPRKDIAKSTNEIYAALVEELKQTESDISISSQFRSVSQAVDFHEVVRCRICHTDVESSSITPCGHHFCTHCILQWLERKPRCPICKKHLKESDVIQDEEFDRIVEYFGNRLHQTNDGSRSSQRNQEIEQFRHENEELKSQVKELKANRKREEAYRQTADVKYLQLAKQLKEKTEQSERLTAEISDIRQDLQLLKKQIGQQELKIKSYEKLCAEKDEEITILREFVIPEREGVIIQLQRQNERLAGEHGCNRLSGKEITALQQLQYYYDREFRRKLSITESMMHSLREKSEEVLDILTQRSDVGDDLADILRNYTSLIRENANLHHAVIKHEDELKRLKRELHHSKARTHELERKYQLERTLTEE